MFCDCKLHLLINTIPCPKGFFQLQTLKHKHWTCITQNCQLLLETENCCFKCCSTGKSPLCTCCQKKWQLNLCHAEATLQSHSAWQLSTLHAHTFPLCKCTGERYTGTVIRTIGCSVFHVTGTKYRWKSISNKIHHLNLICKTQFSMWIQERSGRACDRIVMHKVDYRENFFFQTSGFYVEGRCWGITHAFENYVSILGSDLQNLAMFTLSEIKNLTVLKHSLVSIFVIKVFRRY